MDRKVFADRAKQIGKPEDRVLRFCISDETPDRDNDIIMVDGWDFTDYQKNPVMLLNHNYMSLPIAKCVSTDIDRVKRKVYADFKFPTIAELSTDPSIPSEEAQTADTVYNAYLNGYLNATSVGFMSKERKERDDPEAMKQDSWRRGSLISKQSLLEVSAVSVPANPNAVIQAAKSAKNMDEGQIKILEDLMTNKGAIPFHAYPLAEESAAWSASTVVGESDVSDLKKICAWFDGENAEVKSSYKLPHHLGKGDGYKTVWNGVKAAMGALLGARGGVDIPEGDRKAVYNHLAKHYKEFDKEAPEFKAYTDAELKSLFGESEEHMTKAETEAYVKSLFDEMIPKAGAKLSAATKAHLQKGLDDMQCMLDDYTTKCKAIMAHYKGLMDGDGSEGGGQSSTEGKPQTDEDGNVPLAGKSVDIDLESIEYKAVTPESSGK